MSSLFEDSNFSKVDRAAFHKELQDSDFAWLENDPKDGSEVIVHLTEKGRDEFIDLFYSTEERKELKRLFKRFDSLKRSLKQ